MNITHERLIDEEIEAYFPKLTLEDDLQAKFSSMLQVRLYVINGMHTILRQTILEYRLGHRLVLGLWYGLVFFAI